MYQISVYIPSSHLDKVKVAMFEKGASKFNNYNYCAWQTKGEGQFRPNENANPAIGKSGKLEKVVEYKVEMVCDDNYIKDVIKAMKKTHPYEEVAYTVIKLQDI